MGDRWRNGGNGVESESIVYIVQSRERVSGPKANN